MQNLPFAIASILGIVTLGVHVFVGGIYVVRPLLAAPGLSRASRWLNYYCWHMTTLTIAVMAGVFAFAAASGDGRNLALVFTMLAALFSALCVSVAITGGIAPYRFPATSLFAAIALVGGWGLVAS